MRQIYIRFITILVQVMEMLNNNKSRLNKAIRSTRKNKSSVTIDYNIRNELKKVIKSNKKLLKELAKN